MAFNISLSTGDNYSILIHFLPSDRYRYDFYCFAVSPPLVVILIIFIIKLFKKYWHKLEPVHVFELNTLLDMAIILIFNFLNQLDVFLAGESAYCNVINFLIYWSEIAFFADFSLGQLDKVRIKAIRKLLY